MLAPAATLVLSAASEGAAQAVSQVAVQIPVVRHVEVAEILPDSSCGPACSRITLQVSANADWRLRVTPQEPGARLAAREIGGGMRLLAATNDALEIAGPRGGSQILVLYALGVKESPELRLVFLER